MKSLRCVSMCVGLFVLWGVVGGWWGEGLGEARAARKARGLRDLSKAALLWRAAGHGCWVGLRWGRSLLAREVQRPMEGFAEKLRIRTNAQAIGRLHRGYDFYIKKLYTIAGSEKKRVGALLQMWGVLKEASDALESSSIKGKVSPATRKALAKVYGYFVTLAAPGKLSGNQEKLLMEVLEGCATGNEMLGYYLLRQNTALRGAKGKKGKALFSARMARFRLQVLRNHRFLREYKRRYPRRKVLASFVYHSALLTRLVRLSQGRPSKKRSKEYSKRLGALGGSLKKFNSSFAKLWRVAAGE